MARYPYQEMSNKPKIWDKKAYLLFEVIISISILSIGLVFVIRSINRSMYAAQAAIDYREAFGMLSEKEFDIQLESEFSGLEIKSEEGLFENNRSYRWVYSVVGIEPLPLGKLSLDIYWDKARRKGSLGIESYVRVKQ